MNRNYNRVILCGTVADAPRFSHSNHGQNFYTFTLAVERLSHQQDVLRIIAGDRVLNECGIFPGDTVTVEGQLRSFNNKSGYGSRLVLSVFAHVLTPGGTAPRNEIRLCGTVCKPTVFRHTPMGREICDVILAVNRRYGRADYLPCIAWGAVAQRVSRMEVGEQLAAEGRLQSRVYRKLVNGACQERTAYEVSIMRPCEPEDFYRAGIDFAEDRGIIRLYHLKEGAYDDPV